jgi:hypothetical protein
MLDLTRASSLVRLHRFGEPLVNWIYDSFIRVKWARHILFLCDRRELSKSGQQLQGILGGPSGVHRI